MLGIYSFVPIVADHPQSLSPLQTEILQQLPELLKNHPNMFSSIQVASTKRGLNIHALRQAGSIIRDLSTPDPFRNVQFAITFNVPPNTPFFPSAYFSGTTPTLSIALEAADELNSLLAQYPPTHVPYTEIQTHIKIRFEQIYDSITAIAQKFCDSHQFHFEGIDISPAPYPTQDKSIGTADRKSVV